MKDYGIELVWVKIQIAFTALGGWLGFYLGGLDGLLIALIFFVALDYITGVMCAVVDKRLSSEVGFKGLFRKMLIFAMVGMAHIIDTHVVGTDGALRSAVIAFYLSNEGISMIENAGHLGLPIPEKLKTILAQLHGKEDKANSSEEDTTGQ